MKNKLLFLCISIFFPLCKCFAQWEINNPYAGSVNTIALFGDKLLIGTGDGIFISSDNGISWDKANKGLAQKKIATLTTSGNTISASVNNGGIIYISIDSGATWIESINDAIYKSSNSKNTWANSCNGMINNATITEIQIYNNILYAATWGAGVFVSYNAGESWYPYNNNLSTRYVRCITRKENKLYAGTDAGMYSAPILSMTHSN